MRIIFWPADLVYSEALEPTGLQLQELIPVSVE